jgi:transcriptional regulator with XRE-family HTH domain
VNGIDLKNLRTERGISQQALSDATGIPKGTIGRIEASGEEIKKVDVLNAINNYFKNEAYNRTAENINSTKLLVNKHRTNNTTTPNETHNNESDYNANASKHPLSNARDIGPIVTDSDSEFTEISPGRYRLKVPLVPEYAHAGYLSGYSDQEYLNELPMHELTVTTPPKGIYRAFEIYGDSMDDGTKKCIPDGTIVTGREIQRQYWKSKIHSHKWPNYVFVHKTEGIICKQIKSQNVAEGKLILTSLNPDKAAYPDFEVEMDDLLQILNIVKREMQD